MRVARTFTYDSENRLLTGSAPTAVTLTYDPLGRLQTSAAGGATTTFLYAGASLAAEYNGLTVLRRYVPGPGVDEPLVWYEGSGTTSRRWLSTDDTGSVIGYSDSTGASDAIYGYGPNGEPGAWSGSRYSYTGQIMIPEAQLYYYKARAYDPILGRFLQTDPVGYAAGDMNLYGYVENDPINATDPTGTLTYTCWEGCDEYSAGIGSGSWDAGGAPPGSTAGAGTSSGGSAAIPPDLHTAALLITGQIQIVPPTFDDNGDPVADDPNAITVQGNCSADPDFPQCGARVNLSVQNNIVSEDNFILINSNYGTTNIPPPSSVCEKAYQICRIRQKQLLPNHDNDNFGFPPRSCGSSRMQCSLIDRSEPDVGLIRFPDGTIVYWKNGVPTVVPATGGWPWF